MENKCSTASGNCETTPKAEVCPTTSQECCPVETATKMWSGAFCEAMHEVQVELLKSKIQKSWGPSMDKVADAVIETMGIQWQSMLSAAKSKIDLKDKIAKIWSEKR